MSSEESDAGYVHTPGSGGEDEGSVEREAADDGFPPSDDEESTSDERITEGTVLLVAVVLATLVIPGIIYLYPALLADRVPFLVAMLVLPFVPAVLLGGVAVWAMGE